MRVHVTNKVMLFASIIYIYIYICVYVRVQPRVALRKALLLFQKKKKNTVIVTNYFTIFLQIVGVINFYWVSSRLPTNIIFFTYQ